MYLPYKPNSYSILVINHVTMKPCDLVTLHHRSHELGHHQCSPAVAPPFWPTLLRFCWHSIPRFVDEPRTYDMYNYIDGRNTWNWASAATAASVVGVESCGFSLLRLRNLSWSDKFHMSTETVSIPKRAQCISIPKRAQCIWLRHVN